MRPVLNIIWLVFAGFWLFVAYMIATLIAFVFIITIPFGVASFRIGLYSLWPFGRTVIPQVERAPARRSATSSGSSSAAGGWRSCTC
jgi:uncharacterized membrane protein YccF (DUF307 family)